MGERLKKIKQVIKKIEFDKKTAKAKIAYLDPKKQMAWLFIILMISFSGVVLASLIKTDIHYTVPIILGSVIFFTIALIILWKLLGIIVEVKKVIDKERRKAETKTMDALLALQEKFATVKEETPLFLKDVYLMIGGKSIKDEEREFKFPINSKRELSFSVRNDGDLMVKNMEAGLVLPSDFVVEKSDNYSIFTEIDGGQVIRYETDKIHAKTDVHFQSLIFTPIAESEYDIKTFIKAENIKPVFLKIKFKIEEEIPEDVAPF